MASNRHLQQIGERLARTSILCKLLFAVVLIGYPLAWSETAFDLLSVAPRQLLPPGFRLWTLLTYLVLERNVLTLCADVLCIHLCGTVLEPLWGWQETARFLAVVNAGVVALFTTTAFADYVLSASTILLFQVRLYGFAGFCGAILVGVKQILPDAILLDTPAGRLKNCHIPLIVVVSAIGLCVVGVLTLTVPLAVVFGVLCGWTYLRFYQPHPNGTVGDMVDHFSFASFFPSLIQPPIAACTGAVHRLLVRAGVCRPNIRRYMDVAQMDTVTVVLPGQDTHDADRRRKKALRDLNERIARQKEAAVWPNMDDDAAQSPPLSPAAAAAAVDAPSPPPPPPPADQTPAAAPATQPSPSLI